MKKLMIISASADGGKTKLSKELKKYAYENYHHAICDEDGPKKIAEHLQKMADELAADNARCKSLKIELDTFHCANYDTHYITIKNDGHESEGVLHIVSAEHIYGELGESYE